MTTIPEELIEKIPDMTLESLWEHYQLLEPPILQIKKVKYGIRGMFDIRIITKGHYEEFPKQKVIRLEGVGEMNLYEYYDEIEERRRIMLEYIYENYNQDVTQGRIKEHGY